MKIKDNFLDQVDLIRLDELINNPHFTWYFWKEQVSGADDGYVFTHQIYRLDEPKSDLYNPVMEIFKNNFKYVSLCRITVNLLLRQETPSISDFHTDYGSEKITTAIFYLNTNNGYTEFQGGDRIDCVRNRLIMFPATTPHRVIGQTDVSMRIVFNFNFIKYEN